MNRSAGGSYVNHWLPRTEPARRGLSRRALIPRPTPLVCFLIIEVTHTRNVRQVAVRPSRENGLLLRLEGGQHVVSAILDDEVANCFGRGSTKCVCHSGNSRLDAQRKKSWPRAKFLSGAAVSVELIEPCGIAAEYLPDLLLSLHPAYPRLLATIAPSKNAIACD
jgi:hypothetical protein